MVASSPSTYLSTSRSSNGAKICNSAVRSRLCVSVSETDIFHFNKVNHSQVFFSPSKTDSPPSN